jgi:hypothetical protein
MLRAGFLVTGEGIYEKIGALEEAPIAASLISLRPLAAAKHSKA